MKAMKNIFVLFFIGFTVSCVSIYGVAHDYDKQVDFANLKTYDWMPIPEKVDIGKLNVERVRNAVNAELQAKNLMMTSNNPDFLIAEHLGTKNKVQVEDWGYGYSRHGKYRRSSSYQYEEGSLILNFVDAKSKEIIWQGVAKAAFDNANTQDKREKLIYEAVQKILKNYPPKPKAIIKSHAAEKSITELQAALEFERKENDKLKAQLNETIRKTKSLEDKLKTRGDVVVQAKSNKDFSKVKINSAVVNADSDTKDQEIIFTVQIIASSTRLATNSPQFKGQKNVWEYKHKGLYKYTVGNQKDLKSAVALQSEFRRKGFSGAFVITFKNGKRIPVREALRILKQ